MASATSTRLLAPLQLPLKDGVHLVDPPVVLAPMAGITNAAFRMLCREQGAGLFVSEMVTARALLERIPETLRMIEPGPGEWPRSIQLYSVDPHHMSEAVKMIGRENLADHIDMNFGCPVPKVTRKGGGAALPYKRRLFSSIVEAAVNAAKPFGIPVTVKMRKGIDADHLTYIDAGKAARDAGVAAVALHGRTASDYYSGTADWDAIAKLREAIPDVQVLGNGDIWSAGDAIRMMRQTGVDGVVVGRGCLGRPWLFGDLQAAFDEYLRDPNSNAAIDPIQPSLGEVADAFKRHAELLVEFFESEEHACRDIRKHVAWYFKGYPVGGEFRAALAQVESLDHMDEILSRLDRSQPYPGEEAEGPRGRLGGAKSCALPENWLGSRELVGDQRRMLAEAELGVSGG